MFIFERVFFVIESSRASGRQSYQPKFNICCYAEALEAFPINKFLIV